MRGSDVFLVLIAILFPPAAAAMVAGCSCDLLINILLTLLGYIPGHIHAFCMYSYNVSSLLNEPAEVGRKGEREGGGRGGGGRGGEDESLS